MDEAVGSEPAPGAPEVPRDEVSLILVHAAEDASTSGHQNSNSTSSSASEPEVVAEPDVIPIVPEETQKTKPGNSTIRPFLRRNESVPPPQQPPPAAPPPPPPSQEQGGPAATDSLSLAQLQTLVRGMPRAEQRPSYAFVYGDAASLPEELEEWFSYNIEDRNMLKDLKAAFASGWSTYNGIKDDDGSAYEKGGFDWAQADGADRERFVQDALAAITKDDATTVSKDLGSLVYIALGCWHETAGLESPSLKKEESKQSSNNFDKSAVQIEWIKRNVQLISDNGGLQPMYDVLRKSCLRECELAVSVQDAKADIRAVQRCELWCAMTLVYLMLDVERNNESTEEAPSFRQSILELKPGLLGFLAEILDKYRWSDTIDIPLTKLLLLTWKAVLITFGGLKEVEKAKAAFHDPSLEKGKKHGHDIILASPLDYHMFRQEISSKYPAYVPPPPLFPIEPENNSILPPIKDPLSRINGGSQGDISSVGSNGASILHQPVHIATPAPSPPPSPAGPGGKGGKKQNYQTNQLFPFMYPPLDEGSNRLGGKGSTDLQDALVGRKWEGSDIPASILEAAELFAKRMRASRAMKQLWEERAEFMKYERGWRAPNENGDVDKLELDGSSEADEQKKGARSFGKLPIDSPEPRLRLVEEFYSESLPHLQSLVMVLLKRILENVAALITQSNTQNGTQSGFSFQEHQNGTNGVKVNGEEPNPFHPDTGTSSIAELDAVRSHEITAKAVSGILILLLKWFKVSHILKFEYLTQLLVDDNYIPLVLKLLQTQEVERIVNYKCDREDLDFFYHCRATSRLGLQESQDDSDSDDAAPPPIKRHRDTNATDHAGTEIEMQPMNQPPEVDELGIPLNAVPSSPVTNFSWRNFFSSINFLRILQKVCKNKAHRNLLLVSYKSSQFLKKCLRVPEDQLRLYTLKLFKNQVPYCGRKWRQSNMRVITAVYLNCRPELRDEWLAGSDVDAEVEESVPLEQALRALTHWHNVKRYPKQMGATKGILNEEQDFFATELAKLKWGEEVMVGESAEDGWEGPVQMDAW